MTIPDSDSLLWYSTIQGAHFFLRIEELVLRPLSQRRFSIFKEIKNEREDVK